MMIMTVFSMRKLPVFFSVVGLISGTATAQPVQSLPDIVVTATRTERPAFDLPASIDAVAVDAQTPAMKSAEFLQGVAGVLARDRQNYAQDEQLSIRGFGARSTFGVRGVRLYTDGIPATMPDGQGQTSHIALGAAERIEVLRGPFSALYGNSSGGVIQSFTQDGVWPAQLRLDVNGGSYGAHAVRALASGRSSEAADAFNYTALGEYFSTDGYRGHSAAQRVLGHVRTKLAIGAGALELIANAINLDAQDPQGLTREQMQADARQAAPAAETFNTRKSVAQQQAGAIYQLPLQPQQSLRVAVYGGHRAIQQFLSVPVSAQSNPLSAGGVVDLDSTYGGSDLRWSWRGSHGELSAGLAYDRQQQRRRGYENFVGTQVGIEGALRRDEIGEVYNLDQYLQGEWRFAPAWSASAGLRHSQVRFRSEDRYITAMNPDDSGTRQDHALTPVAGLVYAPQELWRLYASYGRGFETPTFNELAYRSDGGAGLNFALPAARSDHWELGSKHRFVRGGRAQVALFLADTRDELAVFSSSGGRTSYQSVGRARRSGVEFGWDVPLAGAWSLAGAYTWLQAEFRSDFSNCATPATCTIPAGSAIPGVPRSNMFAQVRWNEPRGWRAALNVQGLSRVTVNDAGSQSAAGYALVGAELGYAPAATPFEAYVRLNNLLDRDYVGSVIVNDANGRYYEPGAARSASAGVRYSF